MAVYNLSKLFDPQYVAQGGSAALTFFPAAATIVPANFAYQINVLRVANNSNAPVTLKMWRVPTGAAADNAHIVVPIITIPVATQTFPYFDVTCLWGAYLATGDAIWALAGTATALVIQGDGFVISI